MQSKRLSKDTLRGIVCSIVAAFMFTTAVDAEELTIITESAPPNSYIENDKLTGRAVEIVQAVLKEIGMEGHKIKVYPWVRGYRMLENEKNVALFATSRTKARENLFKWAGPITTNEVNLYKLKSRDDIQVKKIEDLKKYKVGSGRSDQKTQFLLSKGIKIHYVNEDKQNIDKLFLGRIDIFPYASTRLKYDTIVNGYDPKQIEKIFTVKEISRDVYVAFSKSTDDKIVQMFQKGFDAIKEKKYLQQILKKWD